MGSTAIPEKPSDRQPWSEYFMDLAKHISTRSTCTRLQVGCVFVRDNRILATGYNGSLPGRQHCTEVGCLVHNGSCIRTVHAESNAIAQAARHGVSLEDSWLYVTTLPCFNCYKNVLASGVSRVYYRSWYSKADISAYRDIQGMSRLEKV